MVVKGVEDAGKEEDGEWGEGQNQDLAQPEIVFVQSVVTGQSML
jgi:hypothetical protein